jgi:GNAT superfamily N-acetyltransferase
MPHKFTVQDSPDERDVEFLRKSLSEHNLKHSTIGDTQALAIFLKDERGQIRAGIYGQLWGQRLEIDYLWVHADLRGQGYGQKLLLKLENQAVRRGCNLAILDTYSFQAPEFYQELGYEIWGIIDGYPNQYRKIFLKKRLDQKRFQGPASPGKIELSSG